MFAACLASSSTSSQQIQSGCLTASNMEPPVKRHVTMIYWGEAAFCHVPWLTSFNFKTSCLSMSRFSFTRFRADYYVSIWSLNISLKIIILEPFLDRHPDKYILKISHLIVFENTERQFILYLYIPQEIFLRMMSNRVIQNFKWIY